MSPKIPGAGDARRRLEEAIRWRVAVAVDKASRDLVTRLDQVQAQADWTANELRRITPQIAALEARLAEVDDRLRDRTRRHGSVDEATASALEQIRAEHERVRARLSAVALYEDRLRRLETASDA